MPNLSDLHGYMEMVKATILDEGFKEVHVASNVSVQEDSIEMTVFAADDWHGGWASEEAKTLYVDLDVFTGELRYPRIEPRHIRELRYLSQRIGPVVEHSDTFRSAFARDFVQELVRKRDDIAGLLTHE